MKTIPYVYPPAGASSGIVQVSRRANMTVLSQHYEMKNPVHSEIMKIIPCRLVLAAALSRRAEMVVLSQHYETKNPDKCLYMCRNKSGHVDFLVGGAGVAVELLRVLDIGKLPREQRSGAHLGFVPLKLGCGRVYFRLLFVLLVVYRR